jgi:hypothetical protein
MNRRDLLKMLGLGTIGLTLPIVVDSRTVTHRYSTESDQVFHPIHQSNHPNFCPPPGVSRWAPNTAYEIGDRVQFSNGKIIMVAMAGTSASVEMINGTIVPLKGRV